MPRIPFAVHSYRLDSLPASAQDLINLYAEAVPPVGRSEVLVRHVPGLADWGTAGTGIVWAMKVWRDRLYSISGGPTYAVYQHNNGGSGTDLGDLADGGSTPFSMAASSTQLVIVASPEGYVIDTVGTITHITDAHFPDVSSVCYIDGYFIFSKTGTDQYIWSDVLDALSYDALSIASAETVPDGLKRVFEHKNELWLFCSRSIEIHRSTGDPDQPFARQSGGLIEIGTHSGDSVAKVGNTVFWLGNDNRVYRADGYQAVPVSTHAIEKAIEAFGSIVAMNAFGMSYQGHEQYVMTIAGSPGMTLVYDLTTGLWHKRSSGDYSAGVPDEWSHKTSVRWLEKCLVANGDGSGDILALSQSIATENGTAMKSVATLPPLWADTGWAQMDRLELEFEPGANASELDVDLEYSDDGGFTWSTAVSRSMGTSGQRGKRVYWNRLGKFRQRVIRFRFDAGAVLSLYGADIKARGLRE
jgi:hypothetical protein